MPIPYTMTLYLIYTYAPIYSLYYIKIILYKLCYITNTTLCNPIIYSPTIYNPILHNPILYNTIYIIIPYYYNPILSSPPYTFLK